MPAAANVASFQTELGRLVEVFGRNLSHYKSAGYDEASLRNEFLNPLFRALGWDVENLAGHIPKHREVEIESRTQIGGRQKRADYLFRTDTRGKFVCEAKKPAEELHSRAAFQAKRYAWNKGLPLAVLTDFEEFKIYIVGGKPYADEPQAGEWKTWRFQQYPLIAQELWNLLSREKVAAGSIDTLLDSLPKRPAGKGQARQQWLIKPDRTRALDTEFLNTLDEARRDLATDLLSHNDRDDLREGTRLNEAVQHILDRLLFLRICEDRDIDTGLRLDSIVETWRKNTGHDDEGRRARQRPLELRDSSLSPSEGERAGVRGTRSASLWNAVVRHFRALDRRPPTHVPYFNGNLFKHHFSEELVVSDEWVAGFVTELSDDESPYLFSAIPVEILGTIYERFLGKIVRPHGRGAVIEEKPEVRKAGGVYYTPSYIVEYIVEQTVGKLLDEINPPTPALSPDGGEINPLTPALSPDGGEGVQSTTAAAGTNARAASPSPLGGERAGERGENTPEAVSQGKRPSSPRPSPPSEGGEGGSPTRVPAKDFERRTNALRILDPACGSGSFLLGAFERVCDHWQSWLTRNPDKRKKRWCWVETIREEVVEPGGAKREIVRETVNLTVSLKRRILVENIHGVDLDPGAVEVTQLSLYLKMLEDETRDTLKLQRDLLPDEDDDPLLPPLEHNIKCGNSLIASDFSMMPEDLVRVRAFDWPVGFPAIMKAGGFDAVIGNPPYRMLQPHNTEAQELDYLKDHYVAAEFKIELFHLFLQRGVSLLKAGGFHGHILPTTLLNNVYAESLRRWLMERCAIQHISVAQGRVFEDADVHTSVVVFKAEADTTARAEHEVLTTSSLSVKFAAAPSGFTRTKQQRFAALPGATWNILLNETNAPLIERLTSKSVALETVCTINRGLVTGDRDKYFSPRKTLASHVPIIGGADVNRYFTKAPSEFVRFERPDKAGGCWDSEVHLAPHKIVIRQIGVEPTASVITRPFAVTANIFTVRAPSLTEEKYLLAIINSTLTSYFWRTMFADFKASFPQITIFSLSQVPVRKIDFTKPTDKARHDKLVGLVDKMLGLMPKLRAATLESERATLQNAATATDQQIDQLVYELYGLTPEEIALVEGNA